MTASFARRIDCIRFALARFATDRSGNVAVLLALSMVVLMLAIGAAVDIGRWLHARDQTIAAVDAAVLAGGRALQTNQKDQAGAIAAAQKYYAQNVTSRLPVTDDSVSFTVADNGMAMTASGTAYIKTPFLQFANIDKLPLLSTSQTQFSKAELAVGGNGGENIEIGLMLDVTGSMAGQKLEDLKAAANDLIDIVIWDDQSKFTSKLAIVPFSEDIRLPTTTARDKARGTGLPSSKTVGSGWNQNTYYLSDCVVERIGSQKYTDAQPKSGQYVLAHYTEDYTGSGNNKKGKCTLPAGAEVMPLSTDKTALHAKVNGLTAAGGTAGHLGTAWAWYTLSPNWASLWPSSTPAAYGTENLRKIAILMTDGEYNTEYDANGIMVGQTGAGSAANGSSTNQARSLCTGMKEKGITVYTVGFDLGGNKTAIDTLSQCATDPDKYYNADNGEELKEAFRDIALKISKLYLTQ
jgi:Flp pilus assembly protein TadG